MTVIQLHNSVHDSQEGAIFVETPKNNEADERIMEVFDDRLGGWGSKKGVCQVIVMSATATNRHHVTLSIRNPYPRHGPRRTSSIGLSSSRLILYELFIE